MRLNKYLFNRVNNKERERGQLAVPKVETPGHPGHPPPLSDAVVK